MKHFLLLLAIPIVYSCKKNITIKITNTSFRLEDFRKPGMDDYQTLIAACDSLPENATIIFDPKIYIFSHTPIILKTFNFKGPATLKREDQVNYTLKEPADENSTYLILNNTDGMIPWDRFLITLEGKSAGRTTGINIAIDIKGDTLILDHPLGRTVDNLDGVYPAGTSLFKNINFFWVLSETGYPEESCSFTDLTFDGNRDNNTGTYSWLLNTAVMQLSKGTTSYRNCTFINSPGETIVGHDADIRNCTFLNLNGSAFHTSADKVYCTESELHSYFVDNIIENTNQINTTITGHSEGAITHSNSGGYYIATGNKFINVGESVLGALYPSNSIHDWGTSEITFTGNTIDGAGRLVYLIDTTTSRGPIHNVYIDKNTLSNFVGFDWSAELKCWPGIILVNKNGS